ncbi:MAG: hypothetical protein FVQ82_17795 [Planctomycetes bacterium]|nr:hypothetical protein [Planctomycetota bacterium]
MDRQELRLARLLSDPDSASIAMQRTIDALRQPGLMVERADRLIDTLFEMNGDEVDLATALVLKQANVGCNSLRRRGWRGGPCKVTQIPFAPEAR